MKAVQLLVRSKLPPDLQGVDFSYDDKGFGKLLAKVAELHPDEYERISTDLSRIGRDASYYQGETIGLDDLNPVIDRKAVYGEMDAELAAAKKEFGNDRKALRQKQEEIWVRYSDKIEKLTSVAGGKALNNIALSVNSGARGKSQQLKAMISTPGVYQDSLGKLIPMFIRRSYSEGLRPAEFLAGTYGARLSVTGAKLATARGGDILKQATQNLATQVITKKDCGTTNGIDLDIEDPSLKGRVLAQDTGPYKAGQILDQGQLLHLRKAGIKDVMARSPMTCQADKGLCSHCLGRRSGGAFSKIGDHVGMESATTIFEPIVQSGLRAKHTAGMAKGQKSYSGLDVLTQFIQSPDTFKDRAAVAEEDGLVEQVEDAPQGGTYVTVAGHKSYVPPGLEISVKQGERVEAGDQLSDGLVDPEDVVRLRGLGAGRKYYAERLHQILEDSGSPTDKRNVEIMARGALDHVVIEDPDGLGDYLPDDVASYSRLATTYRPPENTKKVAPKAALGQYLQKPTLHYTIGTRITPKVIKHLEDRQQEVYASPDEPLFRPDMQRLRTATHNADRAWIAGQTTSYLKGNLVDNAVRGSDENVEKNIHFAPRLSIGAGFGDKVRETGEF
jgi:DNA-directed RNA polymerase subunit beta'